MNNTKIVCTLGPATDQIEILTAMVAAGMNVARMNFSHGMHADHARRIQMVREAEKSAGRPVGILLDTKGPEIRIGELAEAVELVPGEEVWLTADRVMGDAKRLAITYDALAEEVSLGTRILLDDGRLVLRVTEIRNREIGCEIVCGGKLTARKGVNIPDMHISMPYLSEADKSDLRFGIAHEVDFIAASFVRNREDLQCLKEYLRERGGERIRIIAKIENREGIEHLEEILEEADGIMVARGDMGVEMPYEEVPAIQKKIIRRCLERGIPVITATQMLESMIHNPMPTRAETADVANAIYDGTSAVMLSGETAAGNYPVEAVRTMARIARQTELDKKKHLQEAKQYLTRVRQKKGDITDAVCHATCTTAYDLDAAAIVVVTASGYTARMIAGHRPMCRIVAGTMDALVYHQLCLLWGVVPILIEEKKELFELFAHTMQSAERKGLIHAGDMLVLTAGIPLGTSGTTNLMKVEQFQTE